MSHKCAIGGCKVPIDEDKLMCGPHWKLVPAALQAKIYELNAVRLREGMRMYKPHMEAVIDACMTVRRTIDGKVKNG